MTGPDTGSPPTGPDHSDTDSRLPDLIVGLAVVLAVVLVLAVIVST